MNAIELMMNEHKNIKKMLTVIRKMCINVMNGEEIIVEDFRKVITFIRIYADSHHHKKEEIILFNRMMDELGPIAEKIVKHGMLVEHDLGRLYVKQLEEALNYYENGNKDSKLDIVGNIYSYLDLLQRHISKEDNVVYTFASRELNKEIINEINEKCYAFEEENKEVEIEALEIVSYLQKKYI